MRTRFSAIVGTVGRFVRRLRPWRESQLISRDGQMIYAVREREGDERQVLHRWRGWEPVSAARFSMLPCFEDYHAALNTMADALIRAKQYDAGLIRFCPFCGKRDSAKQVGLCAFERHQTMDLTNTEPTIKRST